MAHVEATTVGWTGTVSRWRSPLHGIDKFVRRNPLGAVGAAHELVDAVQRTAPSRNGTRPADRCRFNMGHIQSP